MKHLPVSADLFYEEGRTDGRTQTHTHTHTHGQTGMMKLIVVFRNFPNAPKNCFPKKWDSETS